MKINKKQCLQAIYKQAENLQETTGCDYRRALELATIQIDEMIKSFTNNNLNVGKILERG